MRHRGGQRADRLGVVALVTGHEDHDVRMADVAQVPEVLDLLDREAYVRAVLEREETR